MSQETETENPPNLLDTLRKFKPTQKPKLTHVPSPADHDSSSEGSPVMRCRDMIVNLDSEEDVEDIVCLDSDDNDCIIVNDVQQITEPMAPNRENTDLKVHISEVRTVPETPPKSDSTSTTSTEDSKSFAESSKSTVEATATNDEASQSVKNASSDEEILRPIKRKKSTLNNTKKKRRKKTDESDDEIDNVSEEQSFQREQVYDSDEEEGDFRHKKKLRKQVVDLLDKGTERELNAIPNMNPKKLEIILSNRPYTSWTNTVSKFNDIKGLNCSMLNVVCDTIIAKDIVLDLMVKCEELASKTEKKISNGGTLVSKPPSILNSEMTLSSYQLLGLNWLALMRSRSLNSILADEMGLGKTIQVIAFLAYLKENELVLPGYPHLIVVPSSTLDNWYEEFQKWCPSLNILIYQGNQDERRYLRHVWFKKGFGDADVILTTYSCATSSREEKKMFRIKEFNYVVFDEAHMLKNMNTLRYEALMQFNGNFKILLTGTPLQNNLLELMSLLVFLMPDLFKSRVHHIKLLFAKCSKPIDEHSSSYEKERLKQVKRIIEPFMLRRLKENVLRDLPAKTVTVEKCPLVPEQQIKYNEVLQEFKEDCASKDPSSYMMYFMLLRKMANHPLLLRYHFTEDKLEKMAERLALDPNYKGNIAQHIQEDLYFKSDYELDYLCQNSACLQPLEFTISPELFLGSGKFQKLTPMLHSLKENGHRVLIFSQFILMLNILEVFCEINNFRFLRLDGSTQTVDRQDLINQYNTNDEIFIFLLSTKAGGLGINLTTADTVIIHDIDFNPYNDKQAEDRCHRVGQTRPVQVFKLISENTVEEGIHTTAMSKLYLEKEITASDDGENADTKTVVQLLKETLGLKDSV